jgi:glycosyltransferase involved in cell wall biosynthesis
MVMIEATGRDAVVAPGASVTSLASWSPLHVGLVAAAWLRVPPAGYGGSEVVLDALARALCELGCRVTLATTGDSTCPVERTWVHEHAVGTERMTVVDELVHIAAAYEVLDECDVVHDHTLIGPLWGARRRGLHVCTTNHGPFDAALTPLYAELSDDVDVVAISRHQARSAHGVRIAAVIHHGLHLAEIPVGDGGGEYLAFLGRMHPDKGVEAAISIARAAGMPLRIAAKMREPAERAYFEQRVSPRLGRDVEFVGELGASEKYAFLGSARCLLNPIAWPEPFGMVMIESLATGTPVLATPLGAAPEIVDHGITGFLARESSTLAQAVARLDGLDRGACRAAAEARFSARRMAEEHIRLYRSRLAQRHE